MRAISFVSTIAAMVAEVATAEAGGFAVREQSAYGLGSSFAGMAAPGDSISSMFWNPAALERRLQELGWQAHVEPVSEAFLYGVAREERYWPS